MQKEMMDGIGAMLAQQLSGLGNSLDGHCSKLECTSSSLAERNTATVVTVEEMARLRKCDHDSVASEAAEWGEANRDVGSRISDAVGQSETL
jgi:hypothetical protein